MGSLPWYAENGRWYGTYQRGKYLRPVDESELETLDIFHHLFKLAREKDSVQGLHQITLLSEKSRILDLGCGTGIWVIDMADQYPGSEVIGIDLNFTQPESIPPNVTFRQQDIEDLDWGLDMDSFDLIHLQMLAGSIKDWSRLYEVIFRCLKPGTGCIEHVELDFEPLSRDGSLPANSNLQRWFQELDTAHKKAGRHLSLGTSPELWLNQCGFTDIKINTKEIPYHPWCPVENDRIMGEWLRLAILQGIEAVSMAPLTRFQNYSKEQVAMLLEGAKRDLRTRKYRSHCIMYIYTAKRPA